jgi:hypothetical protein
MYVSFRNASWRILAIGLVVILGGFGTPALHAKEKAQGCGQVVQRECPAPVVRQKPALPPAETCCPVDPKDVKKAQKAAEHAQHEAAEACKRQQKAVAKAQHELDEAEARANGRIEDANAKLQKRNDEYREEQAKLDSLSGGPNEAVAQTTPQTPPESGMTQTPSESDIMRSKPEPEPSAPVTQPTPQPNVESQAPSVAAPTPPPTPAPAPAPTESMQQPEQTRSKPTELPKTAGELDLIGLIGLASITGSYLTRRFRR